MKYTLSPVPVIKLAQDGEPQNKRAPIASLGVSVHSDTSKEYHNFEFVYHTGAFLRIRQKKSRKWLSFLSLGLAREGHLLKTFKEIDHEKRGVITKEDLKLYASKNHLPMDYIDGFFSAIKGDAPLHQDTSVKFGEFKKFVSSKEEALRRAFGLFDVDGDGKIDAVDLELSLNHVRVCCPLSSCTYRCRKKCIRDLVAKVDRNDDKKIEFWEFRKFFMLLPQDDVLMEYWLSAKCSERCDVGGCVVIHDGDRHSSRKGKQTNPWGHLFAGAFAGAASRTAVAPLETLRLNAMTGSIPVNLSPVQAARNVCATTGWKSLYKGNLTNVLRSAPQKALDFFAFDAFKNLLGGGKGEEPGILKTFMAAGLAGATSNVVLYPLEVVRSRLTIDSTGWIKIPSKMS